ncbi:MAG: hypothetical protein R3A12_10525 [Ignavibacteria bacterium]
MKIIDAKDLTDEQWKSVALMEEFLKTEIYPQFNDGEDFDWENVKNKVMKCLKGYQKYLSLTIIISLIKIQQKPYWKHLNERDSLFYV